MVAKGQNNYDFVLDLAGQAEATFEFALYHGDRQISVKPVTFKEKVELTLKALSYADGQLTYEIENKGPYKTAKEAILKYTSTNNPSQPAVEIPLGQIEKGVTPGQLPLNPDLGDLLEDTYNFQLCYDNKPLDKQSKPVKFNIDLVMSVGDLDEHDQVTVTVKNEGNLDAIKPIELVCKNTDNSNNARLILSSPKISAPLQAGSSKQQVQVFKLNFNHELAAKFRFELNYGNPVIKRLTQPEKEYKQDLKLGLTLTYNAFTGKLTYKVEHEKGRPWPTGLTLEYESINKKQTLKLDIGKASHKDTILIPDNKRTAELTIDFDREKEATFNFSLKYWKKDIGVNKQETYRVLPKIELTVTPKGLEVVCNNGVFSKPVFQLTIKNSSKFDLDKQDLDRILLRYKAPGVKATLTKKGEVDDIEGILLSKLLPSTSIAANKEENVLLEITPTAGHGSLTITPMGHVDGTGASITWDSPKRMQNGKSK